jgi:DNA polymerase-3 subunit gamma/tau
MVLIRLAHAADLPTLDEALKSLDGAQTASPSPGTGASASSSRNDGAPMAVGHARVQGSGGGQTMRLVETEVRAEPVSAPAEPVAESMPAVTIRSLADLAALADQHRDMTFKVMLKRCVRPVRVEAGRIDVVLTDDAPRTLLNDMTARLRDWTGRNWLVSLSKEEGGQTLAELETAKRETAFLDARNDPTVAAILAKFPGAKVIDVRIPDAPDAEDGEDGEEDLAEETSGDEDDN